MNYSIRNLILATAVIALILASLFNGGKIAVVMTMMVYAFAAAMAILAFVARQKRQAFAIGFLIGFAAFFLLMKYGGGNEFDIRYGLLPTTKFLWWLHQKLEISQSPFEYGKSGQNVFAWLSGIIGGAFAVYSRDGEKEDQT